MTDRQREPLLAIVQSNDPICKVFRHDADDSSLLLTGVICGYWVDCKSSATNCRLVLEQVQFMVLNHSGPTSLRHMVSEHFLDRSCSMCSVCDTLFLFISYKPHFT